METYFCKGTCSRAIQFEVNDEGVISFVEIIGGCDGNRQGVAALATGMKPEDVIAKCKGINCHGKGTSCPDQLARALEGYLNK